MLSYRDSQLCLEGKSLQVFAEELGTPFFILSEARLRANYYALVRGLSHSEITPRVRYCGKTNNEHGVMSLLASCGSHVLVSHPIEAQLALQCGFAPEKVAYQRPIVLEEDVLLALEAGVAFFHIYRMQELRVLEKVASEFGRRVKISLRLRNDSLGHGLSYLSFLSSRLGFRESEIFRAAERVHGSDWLTFAAINLHGGTQLESIHYWRALLRKIARVGASLQSRLGVCPEETNIGGGIPSPSLRRIGLRSLWSRLADNLTSSDSPQDLEEFSRNLAELFLDEVRKAGLNSIPALAVEPGRSVVGNAALLVTRVRAVDGKWVYLDASRNYLLESPLQFTRRILPITKHNLGKKRYYHLSGSSLNTLDVIDFRRRLTPLVEGDLLAICDAGAYSISRNSRIAGLSPAVYLLGVDGSLKMIRRAENLSDLTSPMEMHRET